MEKTNNTPHDEPMTQPEGEGSYDYTFVTSVARIALYDDLRSAPRVTEIMPASTPDYIEALASTIYNQAKQAGGSIPYTVVREVSENFIHARFTEIIVSILDGGNTIRFADQGPGISDKKKAQLPGFSSAVEPMKGYIRGVGSGLPIVCDYLDFTHGSISIDDNIGQGTVVTISMNGEADAGDGEECAQVELPVGKYAQGGPSRRRANRPRHRPTHATRATTYAAAHATTGGAVLPAAGVCSPSCSHICADTCPTLPAAGHAPGHATSC